MEGWFYILRELKIGSIYKHFKGKDKIYKVEDVAIDCENLREMVIYRALYGDNKLWVRDKEDFLAEVGNRADNVTNQKYKFELYGKSTKENII